MFFRNFSYSIYFYLYSFYQHGLHRSPGRFYTVEIPSIDFVVLGEIINVAQVCGTLNNVVEGTSCGLTYPLNIVHCEVDLFFKGTGQEVPGLKINRSLTTDI